MIWPLVLTTIFFSAVDARHERPGVSQPRSSQNGIGHVDRSEPMPLRPRSGEPVRIPLKSITTTNNLVAGWTAAVDINQQVFQLLLDTVSPTSWVPSTRLPADSSPTGPKYMVKNDTCTDTADQPSGNGSSCSGVQVTDRVSMGSLSAKAFKFTAADNLGCFSDPKNMKYNGVLALGRSPDVLPLQAGLEDGMKSPVFMIDIPGDQTSSASAWLTVGESSQLPSPDATFETLDEQWSIPSENLGEMTVDIQYSFISLPGADVETYYNSTTGSTEQDGVYYVDCDVEMPQLTILLVTSSGDTLPVVVPGTALKSSKVADADGGSRSACVGWIARTGSGSQNKLGAPFASQYLLMFDDFKNTVSVAKKS